MILGIIGGAGGGASTGPGSAVAIPAGAYAGAAVGAVVGGAAGQAAADFVLSMMEGGGDGDSDPCEEAGNEFPTQESQLRHIFRDAEGHIPDTPSNRQLLKDVANNPKTTLGTDRFGNVWSAKPLKNGTQAWTQTRNGVIQNGGINQVPKSFNPQTGLSGSGR